MTKAKINVTIDPFVLQQAKDKGINISETAERAVVSRLNPENEIDKVGNKCEYCGVEMRQATANDMNGLYWFLPDEKWICPTCEHEFTKKIINSTAGNVNLTSTMTNEKRKEITQEAREFVNAFKKEILEQIKSNEPFQS
jgi:hypothetical protein